MIEFGNPSELITIFGIEKMRALFDEFRQDAFEKMSKTEQMSLEELRLTYHALKSSALVFCMENFAQACGRIEDMILKNHLEKLEKEIKNSKLLLEEDIKLAEKSFSI